MVYEHKKQVKPKYLLRCGPPMRKRILKLMKENAMMKIKLDRQSVRLRLYKSRMWAIKSMSANAVTQDKENQDADDTYAYEMRAGMPTDDSETSD